MSAQLAAPCYVCEAGIRESCRTYRGFERQPHPERGRWGAWTRDPRDWAAGRMPRRRMPTQPIMHRKVQAQPELLGAPRRAA